GLDLELAEHEPLAFLGERASRRRNPLPLGKRTLERREPFGCGVRPLRERVAFVQRLPRSRSRVERLLLQLPGRGAATGSVGLGCRELGPQPARQALGGLPLDGEARDVRPELVRDSERRLALAGRACQLALDLGPLGEELLELRLEAGAAVRLRNEQTRK